MRAAGIPEDQLDAAAVSAEFAITQAAADVTNRPANAVTGSLAYRVPQQNIVTPGNAFRFYRWHDRIRGWPKWPLNPLGNL